MFRMANSRTFSRRAVLAGGLGLGVALTTPPLAQAFPFDPDRRRFRAQGDPDFHPVTFRLPAPTGRKALGTTALHLIDQSRPDPRMPSGRRELMISL
jgi:hypothetical protein